MQGVERHAAVRHRIDHITLCRQKTRNVPAQIGVIVRDQHPTRDKRRRGDLIPVHRKPAESLLDVRIGAHGFVSRLGLRRYPLGGQVRGTVRQHDAEC